jgi:hypothetical protein
MDSATAITRNSPMASINGHPITDEISHRPARLLAF